MRLLRAQSDGSCSLVNFQGNELPPYAILSHTWGADGKEVTYQDLRDNTGQEKVGHTKLDFCKNQAAKDNLHYFWIDTCCIDKSSSAELSEAINSMFNWYRKASKCYVYLSDVPTTDSARGSIAFSRSRWFTRGWTLQELLAPQCVQFFSKEGDLIGDKHSRAEEVSEITNISIEALQESNLSRFSVEERMRWAEKRETTREEDRVYSLLGIFKIYMPPIYGEGEDHARKRMEEQLRAREKTRAEKLSSIQLWLSAPDPSVNYQKALKQRQLNTGLWFLESERYASWRSGNASFLWLYGIPGCGKTILTSTILENIFQYRDNNSGYATAHFYFDFNDVQKQDPERMLQSVIVQLARQADDIPPSLDDLFSSHDNGKRPPALDELLKALCGMMQQYSQVFIVLDALDECTQRFELMKVLEEIANWNIPNLHLLITSREEQDIKSCLEGVVNSQDSICLQTDVVDKDIQLYIRQRLSDDKNLIKWRNDATIQQEIEDTLTKGSKGMFRWVVCQLDTLGHCLNRSRLRKALKTLPPTLDKTYERILNNIDGAYAEYAICILQWLAFSERPMLLDEIAEVIAIDVSRDPEFSPEEILEDPSDALKICSSLVTVTETYGWPKSIKILALAHYSVKEFLVSDRIQRGPAGRYGLQAASSHNALAIACLGYLNQFQETEAIIQETLPKFKLARYSAECWYIHARKAGDRTGELNRLAFRLLSTDNPAYFNWVQIHNPDSEFRYESLMGFNTPSPLYYASLLGLEELVSILLTKGADVNVFGGNYNNALHAAITKGHEGTVRILLEAGANVGPDRLSNGALHRAVAQENCTPSLVSMLLEFGAPTSAIDANNMTPLHYCVEHNHSVIATQLIGAKVPVDIRVHDTRVHQTRNPVNTRKRPRFDVPPLVIPPPTAGIETGLTPLHSAVLTANIAMTKLLLKHGANPNALSDCHETPLHLAFGSNLSSLTNRDYHNMDLKNIGGYHRFLDIEHQSGKTTTGGLYNELIELQNVLLEDPRTCPNMRDYTGKTPLHYVRYGIPYRSDWVLRLLLHGADPNCCDSKQRTPLHLAIEDSDLESVNILVHSGAKVEQEDNLGCNALHYAAQNGGHEFIVAILKTEEAKVRRLGITKDRSGQNALHHLFYGSDEVHVLTVRLLVSHGVDSSAVDNFGNTPLAIFARRTPSRRDYDIWKYLLSKKGNASYVNEKAQNYGHLCSMQVGLSVPTLTILNGCGVDLSGKDWEGSTALHIAAMKKTLNAETLTYLVDVVGLRVTEKDKYGRSALQLVTPRQSRFSTLYEALKSEGKEEEDDDGQSLCLMLKLVNAQNAQRIADEAWYVSIQNEATAPTTYSF